MKKGFSRILKKLFNKLIGLLCLAAIAGAFYWVVWTYLPKLQKEKELASKKGTVNLQIEEEKGIHDKIYDKSEGKSNNKAKSIIENADEEHTVNVETDEIYEELEKILPVLSQLYQNGQFNVLYDYISQDILKEASMNTDKDYFAEKEQALMESTGHKHAALLFHNIFKVGKRYICPVTIAGIKEHTEMNLLYDYENAVETVFTIYPEEEGFTYLPFNEMFGRPTDPYSIIMDNLPSQAKTLTEEPVVTALPSSFN